MAASSIVAQGRPGVTDREHLDMLRRILVASAPRRGAIVVPGLPCLRTQRLLQVLENHDRFERHGACGTRAVVSCAKALDEATALGLTNETLKQFFLAQIQQRKR
jgi:hypothetical protein